MDQARKTTTNLPFIVKQLLCDWSPLLVLWLSQDPLCTRIVYNLVTPPFAKLTEEWKDVLSKNSPSNYIRVDTENISNYLLHNQCKNPTQGLHHIKAPHDQEGRDWLLEFLVTNMLREKQNLGQQGMLGESSGQRQLQLGHLWTSLPFPILHFCPLQLAQFN